jgi:hypothetical protein
VKRFIRSKLALTLAALIMIAAAIAIPLSGSIAHSHAAAAIQVPFNVTFTFADCNNPSAIVTVIPSLKKGDLVNGTISYVDINDLGEASQGENLVLTETNGPFTKTVIVDSGTQTLSFTAAANNDSLTACITGEVDTDQQATISGTVTTVTPTPSSSPTSEPHFPLAPSHIVSKSTTSSIVVFATTESSCSNPLSNPLTLVKTLHKGDVVNIQAEVVPTNGESFSGEQSEGEFLKVYDIAGDSIHQINYLASSVYAFTATGNDTLKACITQPGPDGDELGTISVTVTLAPPPPPTPIQDTLLAKVFFCLLDRVGVGTLIKIAGPGARFAQFEGKVFRVLNYTYTGASTFVTVVQDIKTHQIFEVAYTIATTLPGGACIDLIRTLTPIRPVS